MNGKYVAIAGLSMAGTAFGLHRLEATPAAAHRATPAVVATTSASPTPSPSDSPLVTASAPPSGSDTAQGITDPGAQTGYPTDTGAMGAGGGGGMGMTTGTTAPPTSTKGKTTWTTTTKPSMTIPKPVAPATGMSGSAGMAPRTVTVPLLGMPVGTVDLNINPANHAIFTRLAVTGLTPGSVHAVNITSGTCGAQFMRPSFTFPDVVADAAGRLSTTFDSNEMATGGLPRNAHFLLLTGPSAHNDSGVNPVAAMPAACANLPGLAATTAHLTLVPQSNASGPLGGTASITFNDAAHTLSVRVQARGLAPGTTHAAHIHSGTCAMQGAVAYMLPDLTANAQGMIDQTVTVAGVTSAPATGWYLNIHQGNSGDILANGAPTLSFRPLLCGDIRG